VRPPSASGHRTLPPAAGQVWTLLPCGLLYSALAVATLAGTPVAGVGGDADVRSHGIDLSAHFGRVLPSSADPPRGA
jgi:hypothetical protein